MPGPRHALPTVALLHYAAPPVIGGVERVLGRQAQLLTDGGFQVRIVAGRGAAPEAGCGSTASRCWIRGIRGSWR